MGFPDTISGGNLTNMRGPYRGRTFLLATPEDIVFQALLPELSGTYAEILYSTIQQGAYADVLPDMVYTITTGVTDFNKPLIRGYIREDGADATTIYIDVQDDNIDSGAYITVFADYDVFPRKPRRSFDVNYVDYDKPFEKLPPTISGLQSGYVEDTSSNPELYITPNAASDPAGNEANATTGWTASVGTIVSSSAQKSAGLYSLLAQDGRSNFDLDTILTVVEQYRITFDVRHTGNGAVAGTYVVALATSASGIDTIVATLTKTDLTFQEVVAEFTHSVATRYLVVREVNLANDGGVYTDNISLKKISASIPFAPVCTAMCEGATIASYLWDVGDGTITTGTTTTNDVTVSFPPGHRWVTFKTTDSNNVVHTIHFEVYVGDLINAAFTLHGAETLQWSGDFSGWSGNAPMFDDVDSIVDNQRFTICVLETLNGTAGPVNTNIALIGRYRKEATKTDGGNAEGRNLQDSVLTFEGFGQSLSNLPVPKFNITDVDSPTVWNDIINPSPVRTAWHVLTRYTTAATLMSFDSLAADLVFQAGAIAVSAQGCLPAINQVLQRQSALCNFSRDGTLRIRQDINFIEDRSANSIIADIQTQDMTTYQITTEYNDTVGQVTGGGLLYNPTAKSYTYFIAKAPTIISTIGEEVQQLNGQILDYTDTKTQAGIDLQNRTASKLSQGRVIVTLSIDLFDSWQFVEPSNSDRYTSTIPATLNLRSKPLDNTTYWQLRSISCSANVKEGTITPRAVLIQETDAGTAGRVVAIIPPASDVSIPLYPVVQPYSGQFDVGPLFNPDDLGGDDWEVAPESYIVNEPKDANTVEPGPVAGRGAYKIYFSSSASVTTTFDTVLGETYTIDVAGDAVIEDIDVLVEMLDGNGQGLSTGYAGALLGAPTDSPATGAGVYSIGNDWFDDVASDIGGRCCNVGFDVSANYPGAFVKKVFVEWFLTRVLGTSFGDKNCGITLQGADGDTLISGPSGDVGTYTNRLFTADRDEGTHYADNLLIDDVLVHGSMDRAAGNVIMATFDITLRNTDTRRGDAFYRDYNVGTTALYAVNNGLLINGATFGSIPPYDASHSYSFNIVGTGSALTFAYGDTVDYDDNTPNPLIITIAGPGAV